MNSPWLNLLWKEWREHQWKLLSLCGVMAALVLASKPDRLRDWDAMLGATTWLLCVPFGLFVGVGVAAGENSRGTLAFARSQPAPLWRLALAKLSVGAGVALLPSMLAVLFFWALDQWGGLVWPELSAGFQNHGGWAEQGVFRSRYLAYAALGTISTLSTYLWTVAVGVNARDEIRAALWALGAFAAWVVLLFATGQVLDLLTTDPASSVRHFLPTLVSLGPLGAYVALDFRESTPDALRWTWVAFSVLTHAGLAAVFVFRLGRSWNVTLGPEPHLPTAPTLEPDFLAPPRRSPAGALAWKELRESAPIVAAGLIGCGLFLLFALATALYAGHEVRFGKGLRQVALLAVAPMVYVAPLVAAVIGIGVTLRDLNPGLNTFWRSRPVSADRAFWVPVTVGLAMLAVCFALPAFLVVRWVELGPFAIDTGELNFSSEQVGIGAAALLLFFASGAFFAAAARNAVYAAILSLGVSLTAVTWMIGLHKQGRWVTAIWQIDLVLVLLAAGCLLMAWAIYRSDWPARGWRRV